MYYNRRDLGGSGDCWNFCTPTVSWATSSKFQRQN